MNTFVLLFIALFLFFLIFFLVLNFLDKRKLNKAKEEYNVAKDKSKDRTYVFPSTAPAGIPTGFGVGRANPVIEGESILERIDKSERRSLFPPEPLNDIGKDSRQTGAEQSLEPKVISTKPVKRKRGDSLKEFWAKKKAEKEKLKEEIKDESSNILPN